MKKRPVSNDKPTVHKTIHIPLPEGKLKLRAVLVAALIAVGHPAEEPMCPKRKDVETLVSFE